MKSEGVEFCNTNAANMAPISPCARLFIFIHPVKSAFNILCVHFDSLCIFKRLYIILLDEYCFYTPWMDRRSDCTWRLATLHTNQPTKDLVKRSLQVVTHPPGVHLALEKGQVLYRRYKTFFSLRVISSTWASMYFQLSFR